MCVPLNSCVLRTFKELVNLSRQIVLTGHTTCTPAEVPVLFCFITYMCKYQAKKKKTPDHLSFLGGVSYSPLRRSVVKLTVLYIHNLKNSDLLL